MARGSKKPIWRWLFLGSGLLAFAGSAIYGPRLYEIARVASAFYAKTLCSGVFVSGRDAKSVIEEDVLADMTPLLNGVSARIVREPPAVTASVLGIATQKAVYRQGLGCTLAIGQTESSLRAQARALDLGNVVSDSNALWPDGTHVALGGSPEIDASVLKTALDDAFSEPDPERLRRTRAIVIVHKGRIVAERYAPGIGPQTALIGWSMTKSIFNALTGILVGDGKLSIENQGLLAEWRGKGDRRGKISLDNLLRMSSGLAFGEDYDAMLSDVLQMLFLEGDKARFAANQPLISAPGTVRDYSSGTSNIVARILREAKGGTLVDYLSFPRRALFDRIGVRSAVIEPDASGNFVASSFMFASPRDWARLGLLFLNDGVWNGSRILPKGWLAYSLKPTLRKESSYGAHIWIDFPKSEKPRQELNPPIPKSTYYMLGHDGQMVAVLPARDLVIVRMGVSRREGAWSHSAFLSNVLKAF